MTGSVLKTDILDYLPKSIEIINNQLSMEAILTRDQRTTSHRVLDVRSSELKNKSTPILSSLGLKIENVNQSAKVSDSLNVDMKNGNFSAKLISSQMKKNSSSRRIRGYNAGYRGFTVTWLRLGSLLVTLLVASIHAAPTTMSSQIRTETQGKWINPCGLDGAVELPATDVTQLTDDQLLSQIVLQAKNALMHTETFRDDFINKSFKINFTKLHEDWASQHYDWLPSTEKIPKSLGEKLENEFLDKLDLDTALLDAYQHMQVYAVALEQIVRDYEAKQTNQPDQKVDFVEEFSTTELKLRMVLCEIQVALVERQVRPRDDVSRSVMPDDYRTKFKDDGERNLRDWLIFRDYMNGLEYVDQVFDHLRRRINS